MRVSRAGVTFISRECRAGSHVILCREMGPAAPHLGVAVFSGPFDRPHELFMGEGAANRTFRPFCINRGTMPTL